MYSKEELSLVPPSSRFHRWRDAQSCSGALSTRDYLLWREENGITGAAKLEVPTAVSMDPESANLLLYGALREIYWQSEAVKRSFAERPELRHCPTLLNEAVQRVRDSITDTETYQRWLSLGKDITYTDDEIETAIEQFWKDNPRATMEEELKEFLMCKDDLAQAATKEAVKATAEAARTSLEDTAKGASAGDSNSEDYVLVDLDTLDTKGNIS